jgi:3-hydroxyisobutyrate dehydrogenase-like beta-hydroxyacid dehydrogenase
MSHRAQKNVGVIGLGIIGTRVAAHLREKRFPVFVWNRSLRRVSNFVGSPAEIAEMCDWVQIFVSDDYALLEVVDELAPALAPRHIVLAHSTVYPNSMRAAAEIVERRGARFIDAPFTGSKMAAEKGELLYYVAGDEAALREARPILEATSKEIIVIGEIGQATAVKIATNMVTAASVQAAAEALALVQTVGLPLEKLVEAMRGNASYSATLAMKLPKMIQADFEPHFSLKHMLKDMQLASRLGLSNYLELAVTGATRDRLLEQMERGHGDDDYSAVVRKYFPDARAAIPEEAELELFKQTALFEPFSYVQPQTDVAEEEQPSNVTPMIAETGGEEAEVPAGTIAVAPELTVFSTGSEERTLEQENGSAATEEPTAPGLPDESIGEETQRRRGFS